MRFLPHKFTTYARRRGALAGGPPDAARAWQTGSRDAWACALHHAGFALAKLAAEVFEKNRHVEGLILLKHGIFHVR